MDEIYKSLVRQITLREEDGFATPEELQQRDRIIFRILTRSFLNLENEDAVYREYWTSTQDQKDTLVALLLIKAKMETDIYRFKWIKLKKETLSFISFWRSLLAFLSPEQRRDIFQRPITITNFTETFGKALLIIKDDILLLFGPIPLPPVPLVLFTLMCHQIDCKLEINDNVVKVSALPHTENLVFE